MADNLDFVRKLKVEAKSWTGEGIITSEQEEKIITKYKIIEEAEEKAGSSKLITVISVMGSILIGIGVILFIAANWTVIPRAGKLAIIFLSMFASYGAGYYLRYEKKNFPKVGASLILLGSIVFGAGIFLIAQIYNISVHYPNGPLMWGLGVLPLAYLLRMRTLLTLALLDLLLWMGMETAFRAPASYYWQIVFVTLYLMAGLALWALGLVHRECKPLKDISAPYVIIGTIVTFLCGYILTFDVYRAPFSWHELFVFYMIIAGLFAVSIIYLILLKAKKKELLAEIIGLSFLMGPLIILALLCMERKSISDNFPPSIIVLISNLIYAAMIVGITVLGYIKKYNTYINIGILFFVLDVVARYFDFFFDLLPRSLFFIMGGIMLLAGGIFLEKKRRKVLASFKLEEASL
jgi:uncharacterized membrane protein